MELGELDETLFEEQEWSAIRFLIADPEGYYISKVLAPAKMQKLERKLANLTAQNMRLKKEVNELRNSTAFRIGRILTFIPGKIKRLFKRRRG
jgi:hypothetical protein